MNSPLVGIVDYGIGNIRSISNALSYLGINYILSNDPRVLDSASHLILPGVGAFSHGMHLLRTKDLDIFIQTYAASRRPILGICLGMQMLASSGTEFELTPGLDLLEGTAMMLSANNQILRLPHVGWTNVEFVQPEFHWLFEGISDESKFYFIHSYCIEPDSSHTVGISSYSNISFSSVIGCGGIVGTQFHPEKSGPQGLRLLLNFSNYQSL